LKFAGVPQTTGPISTASEPKFTILWEHVEEISLLKRFFPILDMCLRCEDIAQVWRGSDFTRRWGGQKRRVFLSLCLFVTVSIARSVSLRPCRYLIYSEADFAVFRPTGATRCTDGGEIWHGGPLLCAKFHLHRSYTPEIEIFTQI